MRLIYYCVFHVTMFSPVAKLHLCVSWINFSLCETSPMFKVYSCCLLKTNFRNMIEIFGCFIKKDPWEYSQYVSHGISKCSSCFPFLLATCLEKVFALINALSRRTSVGTETAQRKDSAPPPLPLPPSHFFRKKTCQAKHAPISCIS